MRLPKNQVKLGQDIDPYVAGRIPVYDTSAILDSCQRGELQLSASTKLVG
jgi:hypothetical protein